MKERPILFNGPMVRAILEGLKTQTRRLVKPVHARTMCSRRGMDGFGNFIDGSLMAKAISESSPFGEPGDRLWVRETWQPFFKDGAIYLADAGTFRLNANSEETAKKQWPNWKPSIHMPRRFSRITLEIVSVRVERLQSISEEDAWAEGCRRGYKTDNGGYFPAEEPNGKGNGTIGWDSAREWYVDLWDSINGSGSWDSNPLVWVIEFKRMMPVENL